MLARSWLGACVGALLLALSPAAHAASVTQNLRVTMADGDSLAATVTGEAPLRPRPLIVEFSPYGVGSGTTQDGSAYNYLLVQIRGTGDSDGRFDALGPQTQADVARTLGWACHQPWSDGRLGLNGFSASAITVYNSLHLALPCVRTAVLRSGTFELYRDLLYPGGINNLLPGVGVLALIGAPELAAGPNRLQRNPISGLDTIVGMTNVGLQDLAHPTLDQFWRERGFRGEAQRLPILMLDGIFDVESRGAFQAFQALHGDGAHLLVVGGHDGAPAGTDDGNGAIKAWFDHYLLGADNGTQRQPKVQLMLSDGSRETYLAGHFLRYDAGGWPVPGTQWRSLWLSAARSGTSGSLNDGSLSADRPAASTTQAYVTAPSEPSSSDPPNAAIAGSFGLNALAGALPLLTETGISEPQALSYTTAPLRSDLLSAGPGALELRLSSTASTSDIWAVVADVWPDGTSHPVAVGRLRTSFPGVIASQSLHDAQGDIVQPYGDYSHVSESPPLSSRLYHVELWPVGNRFRAGHRARLVILGASAASLPASVAVNTVGLGGAQASRLLLPVLPPQSAGSAPRTRGALPRLHLRVSPGRVQAGRTRCLRFTVTAGGHRVGGARVQLGHRAARTGRRGGARICVRLSRGRHVAGASRPGYRPARAAVTAFTRRGRARRDDVP